MLVTVKARLRERLICKECGFHGCFQNEKFAITTLLKDPRWNMGKWRRKYFWQKSWEHSAKSVSVKSRKASSLFLSLRTRGSITCILQNRKKNQSKLKWVLLICKPIPMIFKWRFTKRAGSKTFERVWSKLLITYDLNSPTSIAFLWIVLSYITLLSASKTIMEKTTVSQRRRLDMVLGAASNGCAQ